MVLTNKSIINRLNFKIYLYDILIKHKDNKDNKYNDKILQIDEKEINRINEIYNSFY